MIWAETVLLVISEGSDKLRENESEGDFANVKKKRCFKGDLMPK